jgi:4-hydroxyphenylacetate 3-monooxygenase
MPASNGSAFLRRISKLKAEIWIDGKQLNGNVCDHDAFKGVLKSKAKLFDLQLDPKNSSFMTYPSPLTEDRVGTSFLPPRSKEDLEKRRLTTQQWAKTSGGMMGRSPDYINTALMSLATAWDAFQDKENRGKNLRKLYEDARENDITFSHTFVSPQGNRSLSYFEESKKPLSAQIVDKNKDGLIIKGARLLATQGGITDELLVLPVGGKFINDSFVYAFSIPSNTPNLKFICRESFAYRSSQFDHPLGSRFEEMDTIVVFDNVLVPWERVFLYNNYHIASAMYKESSFYPMLLHQTAARQVVKTEFLLGAAQLIVDTINISDYQHVQEKMSEIIIGLETMKALLLNSEMDAKEDKRGTMIPSVNPLSTAIITFSKLYPRFTEILQLLGASGVISIPTEKDFNASIKNDLTHYLQGASCDGEEKTKIFRLIWDMSTSAFGGRQTLYERFFFGDPIRLSTGLYNSYSKDDAVNLAKSLLDHNS